jgi:hypothetical protein
MDTNITREILYGKRPVYRINPQTGKKEWYYLDPRGADTFSDMKTIDVENENSPNPQANAIQNYLYNNDSYNYNLLYGNTPPSSAQTQTIDATSTLPINQPNNITQATPNLNQDFQPSIFTQQKRRNVENDLLMDAMDMLYGMNRGINGMTLGGLDWLGNKFGFDSKMNNYRLER